MWLVMTPKNALPGTPSHVIPHEDLRPHDCSHTCWCRPEEDDEHPNLWIHNALDGREDYERGTLLAH